MGINLELLSGLRHGLERENLRIEASGKLSKRSHEEALGVSPKNETFTLDFAESQLEIVTPIHTTTAHLIQHLSMLDQTVKQRIAPEQLWRGSMPPPFQAADIKLAHFGESEADLKKQRYRTGLCHRYGKMMQIISGIHYNLSFPDFLFAGSSRNVFYFQTIRQFLRQYWLLIILFGASPLCFSSSLKSSLNGQCSTLKSDEGLLYYGPEATSLRLSELGYHNPAEPSFEIQYDSLETYVASLQKAVSTPYPPYASIPKTGQLNDHYLQIENEYYAPIRPKAFLIDPDLSVTERLARHGVNYLEIRILDLNPLLPLQIDQMTLDFIDVFMLYMALESRGNLNLRESQENALKVAKFGLNFNTELMENGAPVSIHTWGSTLLKTLLKFAKTLGSPAHLEAVSFQISKFQEPDSLPASKILAHRQHYLKWMLSPFSPLN